MTVDRAVAIALENNANVRNARLEADKGQTRITAMRTRRLPAFTLDAVGSEALNRLSFAFQQGAFGTFEGIGPIPNRDTRIDVARTFNTFLLTRLTQPLTQQHKISLAVHLYEASLAVDQEHVRAARAAIAREVKSAYFGVLAAQSYAAAAKEAVAVYDEVEREMNVRVSQKIALQADHLDAKARLLQARAAELSAMNALAAVRDQLNYLVGREIDVSDDIPDATALPAMNVETRADVREAELRVEQARLDARLKSAENIPDISLVLSRATPIHFDVLPANLTTAGVILSYEPFTWGRRSAELAEKRLAVEQAQNTLRDRRAAAVVEIASRKRKVDEAAAQIAVRDVELDAARERLRVMKTRFEQRAARPDEVFAVTAALSEAAARKQEAISAYWTARADYDNAVGRE